MEIGTATLLTRCGTLRAASRSSCLTELPAFLSPESPPRSRGFFTAGVKARGNPLKPANLLLEASIGSLNT